MSTPKMTRKKFLEMATALAAAGLKPLGSTNGQPQASLAAVPDGPLIGSLNPIRRLYPAQAKEITGETPGSEQQKLRFMLPWFGPGEITWNVTVQEAGSYEVALCYSSTVPGSRTRIHSDDSVISYGVQVTEGFFLPDSSGPAQNPGDPAGNTFWSVREFYKFERVLLRGQLRLTRGVNVIKLQVSGPKGRRDLPIAFSRTNSYRLQGRHPSLAGLGSAPPCRYRLVCESGIRRVVSLSRPHYAEKRSWQILPGGCGCPGC